MDDVLRGIEFEELSCDGEELSLAVEIFFEDSGLALHEVGADGLGALLDEGGVLLVGLWVEVG